MRVVLLGSGKGSNAEAILKAYREDTLGKTKIVGVVSDKEEARILEIAKQFDVPAQFIHPGQFKTKLEGDAEWEYIKTLQAWQVDLVVLVGFMRVIKDAFLQAFPRIINLHPSLLPAFPGLDSIKQAWDYGVKVTGCTVHWVNNEVDAGKIIEQGAVRIENKDTLETLRLKVHGIEHQLLPEVISDLSLTLNLSSG